MLKLIAFYCLFLKIVTKINGGQELSKDYCQKESFKPSCSNHEVILMKSALHGRMKIGRCVIVDSEEEALISNQRYLGCSANVLHVLDGSCTGKSSCEIAVLDDELQKLNQCFKGLVSYMEAEYTCIPVISENSECHMLIKSSSAVYILSSSLQHNKCGTPDKPLILETSAGQKMKIGIINLNNSNWSTYCPFSIGRIIEVNSDKNKEFCIDSLNRHQVLYTSHKNKIEMSFERDKLTIMKRNSEIFLISLEAIGCSDLLPAEDSWLKRIDDTLTIGCYSSRKTWQLKCLDNKWIGVVGNCSGVLSGKSYETTSSLHAIPKDPSLETLGIIAIFAVGLAICGLIIGIGYLCGRRYEKTTSKMLEFKEQNQNISRENDANFYNNRLLQADLNSKEDVNYKTAAYYVLDDVNNHRN